MPRGVEFKVPLRDAFEAHRAHLAGWSIRALARLHWRQWGYASAGSACEGLRRMFRALDLPVRPKLEAVRLALTIHGNDIAGIRDPAHPEHSRYLAHAAHLRRLRKERREREGHAA